MRLQFILFPILLSLFANPAFGQFGFYDEATDCDANFRLDVAELEDGEVEDCNRDGKPDICALQSSGYEFASGQTSNQAIEGTETASASGQLAFLNDDRHPDVFALLQGMDRSISPTLKIYLSDEDGQLRESQSFEAGFGFRQLRGMLGQDAFSAEYYFRNNGDGTFQRFPAVDLPTNAIKIADFNADSIDDLLLEAGVSAGEESSYSLSVRLNQGDGTFADAISVFEDTGSEYEDLTPNLFVNDIDADTIVDITLSTLFEETSTLRFLRNDGSASFQLLSEATLEGLSSGTLQIADIDKSGKPDLLFNQDNSLFHVLDFDPQETTLSATLAGRSSCASGRLEDVDGDGDPDLVCSRATVPSLCCRIVYLLYSLNDGSGNFTLASREGYYGDSRSLPNILTSSLLHDVNEDGLPDRFDLFGGGTVSSQTLTLSTVLQAQSEIVPPSSEDSNSNYVPDSCETTGGLSTRRYSLWNSFADLTNILELVNLEETTLPLLVVVRDASGRAVETLGLSLAPRQQFDVLLNNFATLDTPGYGVVEVVSRVGIQGAVSYYRTTPVSSRIAAGFDTGEFDFAFQIPLAAGRYSERSFLFNSFQPSALSSDQSVPVPNWLTLVNLSSTTARYRVETFVDGTNFAMERIVEIPEFGRMDLDGGHGLDGGFSRGVHKVTLIDGEGPYLPLLTRYGATSDANRFAFAIPSFDGERSKFVSTGGNAMTWLEVSNASALDVGLALVFRDALGVEFAELEATLPAFATRHFLLNDFIGNNASATMENKFGGTGNALSYQVNSYFYNQTNGSIETAYRQSSSVVNATKAFASYNLYLGMYNWLRIHNDSSQAVTLSTRVSEPGVNDTAVRELDVELSLRGFTTLDIHNTARFNTIANSYGLIEVSDEESFFLDVNMLRVRPTPSAGFDFIMPTQLQ